jgi:hypothetical protein
LAAVEIRAVTETAEAMIGRAEELWGTNDMLMPMATLPMSPPLICR